MIELVLGVLIGTLLGAGIVGIVIGGSQHDRETMAFRSGYRRGLEDRET